MEISCWKEVSARWRFFAILAMIGRARGLSAGATTRAALRATRMRKPKKLVLAVPVAASDSLRELMREADDVVCLEDYKYLGAIGLYYSDFSQTSDDEVMETLARFPSISEAGEKA